MRTPPQSAIAPLAVVCSLVSIAYTMSALVPTDRQMPAMCGAIGNLAWQDIPLVLGPGWSTGRLLGSWLLMVFAMMPPLILRPLLAISIARRPIRCLVSYAVGYGTAWTAYAICIVPATILLNIMLGTATSAVTFAILAVAWSMSPHCQSMRNACHRNDWIAGATRSSGFQHLREGTSYAATCAGICWPWMLLALTIDTFHLVSMAVISGLLTLDRSAPPAVPRWQLPPLLQRVLEITRRQNVLGRL